MTPRYSIVAVICPRTAAQAAAIGAGSVALVNEVDGVDQFNPRLVGRPTAAPAPTTGAPVTPAPTTAAPTTGTPTRAILNTVADCGVQHLDCTERLLEPYTDTDSDNGPIRCTTTYGTPTFTGRCICTGAYHCHRTLTLGRCEGMQDTCLERNMTDAPSAMPTTAMPTTALPSQAPATSLPTPEPTFFPSLSDPTHSPTTPMPTTSGSAVLDTMTRSELEALLNCNRIYFNTYADDFALRSQLFATGITECPAPTAAPTAAPTTADSVAEGNAGATGSSGDEDASSDDTMMLVVILMVLLVLATVGGAVIYLKSKSGGGRGGQPTGFDNPMYADSASSPGNAAVQSTGGYMDVSANAPQDQQQSTGYMDVALQSDSTSGYMDVPAAGAVEEAEEV